MQTVNDIREEYRKRELNDITLIMETKEGRRYFARQLELSHVFHTSISPEPIVMAFKEGERNIGLMLFNDITESSPKKYQVMMLEAKEQRQVRQKKEDAAMITQQEAER